MAKKVVFISDLSGTEIGDGAARLVVEFADKRRGKFTLDVTEQEAAEFASKGQKVNRGRKAAVA